MNDKQILEYITKNDSLNEINFQELDLINYSKVFIICCEDLLNCSYMEISFNSPNPNPPLNKAKFLLIDIKPDTIKYLKNNKKEFFIVNKVFLLKNGIDILDEPNLYYLKEKMKINISINGTLFRIEKSSQTPGLSKNNLNNNPKQIILQNNINPNILNMNNSKPNSNNNINNINVHILNCLILFYANKKEIFRLISNNLPEKYDLQNYTLVNKTWIDTFKNNFYYNNIKEILLQQNIGPYTYDDFKKNLQYYHSIPQISSFVSLFNGIPNDLSQTIKLLPGKKVHSKFLDIIYPSNFELVNVSLFNL